MTEEIQYEAFLSHNSQDEAAVERLARRLADEAGLRPFLDKWHLVPGEPWQEALEQALDQSCACAVFIGPRGISPWEHEEMRSALSRSDSSETRMSQRAEWHESGWKRWDNFREIRPFALPVPQ